MVQLTLPFSLSPDYSLENFIVFEEIVEIVTAIKRIYSDKTSKKNNLFLYGPEGTGKTHLLHGVIELINKIETDRQAILFDAGSEKHDFLAELSKTEDHFLPSAVGIDNIHNLSRDSLAEMWNLENKLSRVGSPLLATSRISPELLFSDNTHVQSRLRSGLVFRLEFPDDAAKILILDKIASDKQVRISREVYNFLMTRKSRNVRELEKLLDLLNTASLQRQRPITIPFIRSMEKDGLL